MRKVIVIGMGEGICLSSMIQALGTEAVVFVSPDDVWNEKPEPPRVKSFPIQKIELPDFPEMKKPDFYRHSHRVPMLPKSKKKKRK